VDLASAKTAGFVRASGAAAEVSDRVLGAARGDEQETESYPFRAPVRTVYAVKLLGAGGMGKYTRRTTPN